ncbi:cytochrome P450 [Favolaschia claudopus]|uniref:Cytochrome P450 n=1 Tax=Favolaschia claudopus TaxID=2862362 RepID=A0AAW0C234_9AGAR
MLPTFFVSVALAEATHLFCHVYEPQTAHGGLALIMLPPTILVCLGHAFLASYAYFFLALSLSIVLYRLSPLHPLYHVPGPWVWRVTKLIGMYMSWSGNQHRYLNEAHLKYGPVVRFGPNEVSIADVDAVPSVLGSAGLPKGQFYDGRKDPRAPSNLLAMQGEPHANRRRLWNRGMSTDSLREYEQMIARRATQLLDCIADLEIIDLAAWISRFTFDFMGDMAFGGGFELMHDEEQRYLIPIIQSFGATISIFTHVPWAAKTLSLFPIASRDRLRKFGVDNARRRIKSTAQTQDLFYHLMDEAGLEKQKPPLGDVIADGALAVVAGADTTASALASLFYFLMLHPKYYRRLQEEIDAHFPPGSDPLDTHSHADMKFLDACINEALRLKPPVPTNGPRQVPLGSQGKLIAGVFIPEGTQVYVPPYSLHLDPRYFSPDPDAFMPERWIDPAFASNTTAFIPFSYGPSNCVGKNLARKEMAMLTCVLIARLEFRFAPGFDVAGWPSQHRDYFTTSTGPLIVSVNKR